MPQDELRHQLVQLSFAREARASAGFVQNVPVGTRTCTHASEMSLLSISFGAPFRMHCIACLRGEHVANMRLYDLVFCRAPTQSTLPIFVLCLWVEDVAAGHPCKFANSGGNSIQK